MSSTSAIMLLVVIFLIFAPALLLAEDRLNFIDYYISHRRTTANNSHQEPNRSEPGIQANNANNEHWHPEERYHHKMERISWIVSIVLTFVIAVGAMLTVRISISTLVEAEKATEAARSQADAATETYKTMIQPSIDFPSVSFSVKGDLITPRLCFENLGGSATKGMYIGAATVESIGWQKVQNDFCVKGDHEYLSNKSTLVPKSPFCVKDNEWITSLSLNFKRGALKRPHITGCFVYGSILDRLPHHLSFVSPIEFEDGNPIASTNYVTTPSD